MHFQSLNLPGNFLTERALRYYENHRAEIEMFATGTSHAALGLDTSRLKYELLNFARPSQDLYYDYQIAKRVLTPNTGGTKIRYALIALTPYYSFHANQSLFYGENFRLLAYAIAFRDLHNFWLPVEKYCALFNENFLASKLPLEDFDTNNVMQKKKRRYILWTLPLV